MKAIPLNKLLYYSVLLVISANFSLSYARFTKTLPVSTFEIQNYLSFNGTLPFQFRILPAILFYPFHKLIGGDIHFGNSAHNFEGLFFLILNFLAMALSIIFMRLTIERILPRTPWGWCAFALPYMAYFTYVISNGANYYYPYDITGLMFVTILLYATVSDSKYLFALVLVFSTLNKETSIFSIILYMMWNASRGLDEKTLALFFGVWISVKLFLYLLFKNLSPPVSPNKMGPGNLYEVQLVHNLKGVDISTIMTLPMIFGLAWMLVIVCRAYLVDGWQKRFLVAIALWIAVVFCLGNLSELRVFGELIPPLTLLLTTTVIPSLKDELGKL